MTTKYGPAQLDPADWDVVGVFYIGNSEDIAREYDWAWRELSDALGVDEDISEETLREIVEFHDNGNCASCGTHFNHGAVVTNGTDTIAVGGTCLQSFGLKSKAELLKRRAAHKSEVERMKLDALDFIRAHDLAEVLTTDHFITQDIERKLYQYGSLSPKQIELLRKLHREAAEQAVRLAEQAEKMATVPALTEGRYEIVGDIVSVKFQSHDVFGDTLKMLVEFEGGNRVWGTVPKAIWDDAEKGRKVSFTAAVKRSDDDEHFGFFSRPTKATLIGE